MATKRRQGIYWRETGCLQEGGRDSLPEVDRVYIYSQTAPWMTPLIRELEIKRDAAKKDAERSPAMWNSYKKLCNQVTKSIREAITSHYQGLINENKDNPKGMWKRCGILSRHDSRDTHVTVTSDSIEKLFESAREEMMNISEWMRIKNQTSSGRTLCTPRVDILCLSLVDFLFPSGRHPVSLL